MIIESVNISDVVHYKWDKINDKPCLPYLYKVLAQFSQPIEEWQGFYVYCLVNDHDFAGILNDTQTFAS